MKVHFICRGNVLRSLIAETYLRSLQLPSVVTTSSGTDVDLSSEEERAFFANTEDLFRRHAIGQYAKGTSDQLTQERTDNQDVTVCMNQRVVDEASTLVALPTNTINWDIVDIGEGHRIVSEDIRTYEEEIFDEITAHVDELAKRLLTQK